MPSYFPEINCLSFILIEGEIQFQVYTFHNLKKNNLTLSFCLFALK